MKPYVISDVFFRLNHMLSWELHPHYSWPETGKAGSRVLQPRTKSSSPSGAELNKIKRTRALAANQQVLPPSRGFLTLFDAKDSSGVATFLLLAEAAVHLLQRRGPVAARRAVAPGALRRQRLGLHRPPLQERAPRRLRPPRRHRLRHMRLRLQHLHLQARHLHAQGVCVCMSSEFQRRQERERSRSL